MNPRPAAPGSVADELGHYLNNMRERALNVGQHDAFFSAVMSVLTLALREGCDDDLVRIDAEADRIARDLKSSARQAIAMQASLDMPTQGNA